MAEKKEKKGGSKISNTEWGMVITLLFVIDGIQFAFNWVGIPFVVTLGTFINRFISFVVAGLAWPTYLYLRGVNMEGVKIMSAIVTFFFEGMPTVDSLPLLGANGLYTMSLVKAEEKLKEETGVDVGMVASVGGDAIEGGMEGGFKGAAKGASKEYGKEKISGAIQDSVSDGADTALNPTDDEEEDTENETSDEDANELGNEQKENEETPQQKLKRENEEKAEKARKELEEETRGEGGNNKSGGRGGESGLGGNAGGRERGGSASRESSKPSYRRGSAADTERAEEKNRLGSLDNILDLSNSYRGENKKDDQDETSFPA